MGGGMNGDFVVQVALGARKICQGQAGTDVQPFAPAALLYLQLAANLLLPQPRGCCCIPWMTI